MAYTTIDDPSLNFRIKLYNGNNNAQNIAFDETHENMQPDLLWIKSRAGASVFNHVLGNSVSGGGKYLHPNTTAAEVSNANVINTFNTNGFSVGGATFVSEGGRTYVAWGWKGGGSASSNSNGSITSSVSANTTSGCSIVGFNGNNGTIGHGLGVKPDVIIIKSRQTVNNWVVLHKNLTGGMDTNGIVLNDTAAETDGGAGMAEPTSSVFTITGGLAANDNNIALVFSEKKGFSKFGKYIGNGSSNGPFVYLGFRPAWVMIKVSSGNTGGWDIYDTKRGFNPNEEILQANSSSAESSNDAIDLLSNGFKIRNTTGNQNGSGNTHIYFAFAESPFVNSNGVPTNAR
tara:strand:- start:260 stop:1294 length:1035 start_codon:yes stop_codon:yes gene_type:complete